MTDAPTRSICGERAWLPARLALDALRSAASTAAPEDVERDLRCTLEAHPLGDHHALVLDLDGSNSPSIWATWTRGNSPAAVRTLPDCPATGPAPARTPCCEFAAHPGAHTWQLHDPWRHTRQQG